MADSHTFAVPGPMGEMISLAHATTSNKDRNFTRSSLRAFIHAADERLED